MTALARRLGPLDAVVVGIGAMLGAGVFAVWAPAAAAAGGGLLLALVAAAAVAACNATSSARLAAAHPVSGGAYAHGRLRLGPAWGFAAGWCFVVGKTASCAAMALTVGQYAAPDASRWVAAAAVVVATAVNVAGVERTARVTAVLVVGVLGVLVAVVVTAVPDVRGDALRPGSVSSRGVLEAAGLLFFAFAGYARVTTLGEEVRDPGRTIPRAVAASLAVVVAAYLAVGVVLLGALGADRLAVSARPLVDVAPAGLEPVVRVAAVLASASVLLSLLAGVARTAFAMGRDRELPAVLARVDRGAPVVAQVVVGAVVLALVLVVDVTGALAASGAGVLLYYAVAGASAWTLGGRLRWVAALGVAGCLVLAASLPPDALLPAAAVLLLGVAVRAVRRG